MKPDALIVVDVQNDFLPGGSLGVAGGDEVIKPLNRLISAFTAQGLPVAASRDWHPRDHCSFEEQGGIWPPHCVAGTHGAEFAPNLELPESVRIISKATETDADAYSAFEQTELESWLRARDVKTVAVGGLATDYCVRRTVEDALQAGFTVLVLEDAVRAVARQPGDGEQALRAMQEQGATRTRSSALSLD